MPEEINRVLTDRLSTCCSPTAPRREENLAARGDRHHPRPLRRQHDDRLAAPVRAQRPRPRRAGRRTASKSAATCSSTLHRPSNVDEPDAARAHRRRALRARAPRRRSSSRCTRARARGWPRAPRWPGSRPPASAAPSRSATSTSCRCRPAPARSSPTRAACRRRPPRSASRASRCAPTRSGPVTITHGTNVLLGDDPARLRDVRPPGRAPVPCAIPLWDGHARRARGRRASSTRSRRSRGTQIAARRMTPAAERPRLRDRPPRHARARWRAVERVDRRAPLHASTCRSTRRSS